MTTTEPVNGHDLDEDVTAQAGQPSAPGQTGENGKEVKKFRLPRSTPKPERSASLAARDAEAAELEEEGRALQRIEAAEQQYGELFSTIRTPAERKKDSRVDRRIRTAERRSRLKLGKANAAAAARLADQSAKLDQLDDREKLDLRKALRKRNKLTNPNAALTVAYRRWRAYSALVAVVAVAGIAFTSFAVAHGLGGENPQLSFYLFEPMFSVPLMVIVLLQSFAAQHSRLDMVAPIRTSKNVRGEPVRRLTGIGWIEVGLLLGSMVMAGLGATRIGDFGSPLFAACLLSPLLVVVAISLQYVLAKVFGTTIAELDLAGAADESSARRSAVAGNLLVPVIEVDLAKGELPLEPDGLPSIGTLMRRYKKSKLTCQCARDVLDNAQKGGEHL